MNKVNMMGRLTRDPETRYTQSGICVARFSIAVPRRFKKDDQPDADFFPVVAWRKTGEFVSKHFTKGLRVAVCGHLATSKWTDNDGHKRQRIEIVAEEVYFADGFKNSNDDTNKAENADSPYSNMMEAIDEELPF